MVQTLKNKERTRPIVNRTDLKRYVQLESKSNSRLAPFHKPWTLRNFTQILQTDGIMAHSYVSESDDILRKEEVIGFVVYRLQKDYFELLNLVVEAGRPDVVNKLLSLIKAKTSANRPLVQFIVRETDQQWHSTLKNAGFQAQLIRNSFDYPIEDGYKFKWERIG